MSTDRNSVSVVKAFGFLLLILGLAVGIYGYIVMTDVEYYLVEVVKTGGTDMPLIMLCSGIAAFIGGVVLLANAYLSEGENINFAKALAVFVLAVGALTCVVGAIGLSSAGYALLEAFGYSYPLPLIMLCFGIVSLVGGFVLAIMSFPKHSNA